jgi:hypothetical protein
MIRLKPVISACILAGALLQAGMAQAATYYVSTTGNNSNSGTSSRPWRTIAYAVTKMNSGDTTYVNAGTYKEGLIRFTRSGTSSAPIKLLNAPGQFPVIDIPSQRVLLAASGVTTPIGWITIEGFEIRNGSEGIKFNNAHDVTIRRNWIHHARKGILGNGTRILIDRNRINHNGYDANLDQGIYANGTAITITNNLIYSNKSYGITLNGSPSSYYSSSKHAGPQYAVSANWIIANNTFAYSQNSSGMVVWGSTCNNARIENNIFYENAVYHNTSNPQGINFVSTTCTGILIRNNLAYATGSGGTPFLGAGAKQGVHYTQSGNIVNTTKPGFVNAPTTPIASPNFALTSTSGAINKGVTTTARVAFNAVSRPQGTSYDVGAYEYYTGGSTAQMLLAPTSAQAF